MPAWEMREAMRTMADHDVVVVGAGPSGLALAIELGSRGVRCLLVERNDRVGYAPRAKTTNVRTRTHLRRWGIADKLAAVAPFGVDYPSTVTFVTRLGGFELARIDDASNCRPARNDLYPEHGQWVPQYKLEQVLREHVDTLDTVDVRFSTDFVSATQDAGHVTVSLTDGNTGLMQETRCRYLVGADGARSAVRDLIGATMKGRYGLSRNYNVVFRAPGLAAAHRHGPATMYWQVNPAAPSLIGPMDTDDVWFFMPTRLPDGFTISDDDAAALIRRSTGIETPIEILSSSEWVASSLIADCYRDRRIFLIGDACHLHPPFGGYGMNMGIADGVDLGWKLAATIRGWGGPRLLDSYEVERRTIHEEVIAEAEANHAVLSNDLWSEGLETDGPDGAALRRAAGERIVAAKRREFHTLGTVLGGCYGSSPTIIVDHDGPPSADGRTADGSFAPSSRPGCLAPHFWRADGRSLYDLFGADFTLLCGPGAPEADVEKARAAAAERGLGLTVIHLTAEEAMQHYPRCLTLIRPDQYVAWRGDVWVTSVLGRIAGDAGTEEGRRALSASEAASRE
jgi:2-polyprenyl-6-methoxyphenol hydroxylase-like FAD-dependent oxidoreductase